MHRISKVTFKASCWRVQSFPGGLSSALLCVPLAVLATAVVHVLSVLDGHRQRRSPAQQTPSDGIC